MEKNKYIVVCRYDEDGVRSKWAIYDSKDINDWYLYRYVVSSVLYNEYNTFDCIRYKI